MGADVLTGYLTALRLDAPELQVNVWEANCEELEDSLLRGEIDVALSSVIYFVSLANGPNSRVIDASNVSKPQGHTSQLPSGTWIRGSNWITGAPLKSESRMRLA